MRTKRAEAIYNGAMEKMAEEYWLNYVDYRDNIDYHGKVIVECLEQKCVCPIWEEGWYDEQTCEASYDEADELIKSLGVSEDVLEIFKQDFEDDYNEIRYAIEERNQDEPYREVLGQSSIQGFIRINSSYEAAQPHWCLGYDFMDDEYLVQLMSWLCLNPAKVKQTLIEVFDAEPKGRWPNCPSRNGKEIVSYEDFCRTYFECPNYCFFAFFGMLPLQKLYDNNFDWECGFTIPKGTTCGFYNTWDGGGTLELIETIRDVSISELIKNRPRNYVEGYDCIKLCVDEKGCCGGYSSYEVYGGTLNKNELLTA